jgi:hypothetical protein
LNGAPGTFAKGGLLGANGDPGIVGGPEVGTRCSGSSGVGGPGGVGGLVGGGHGGTGGTFPGGGGAAGGPEGNVGGAGGAGGGGDGLDCFDKNGNLISHTPAASGGGGNAGPGSVVQGRTTTMGGMSGTAGATGGAGGNGGVGGPGGGGSITIGAGQSTVVNSGVISVLGGDPTRGGIGEIFIIAQTFDDLGSAFGDVHLDPIGIDSSDFFFSGGIGGSGAGSGGDILVGTSPVPEPSASITTLLGLALVTIVLIRLHPLGLNGYP